MTAKKSAPKKKRSPKKRKPKVKLDNKKVMALAAVMIFVCAVILSFAFVLSSPDSKKASVQNKEKTVAEKQKNQDSKNKASVSGKTQKTKTEKKTASASKNKPEVKMTKTEAKKVQPEEKTSSSKTEATAAKKSETKKAAAEKNKTDAKVQSAASKKESQANLKAAAQANSKAEAQATSKAEVKGETKVQPETENKTEIKNESKNEGNFKFNIPQSLNNARLCIIIDDGGQKTTNLRKYTTLPFPITIAVLPQLPSTKECARIIVADKKELMLHQPMQAQNLKMDPGPGAILPEMSTREIYATVSRNLAELGPNVKGFNNHEGSLITCDLNMMGAVLDAAADNKVYFVDSRTSKDTMASFAALERDMKILEREVFIDDIIDRGEMLKQILRGIDIANKNGKVIMIGHVDKSAKVLPALLLDMYPELKAKGYRFVFPSQLL